MDDDQVQTLRDRQAGLHDKRQERLCKPLLEPSFTIFDEATNFDIFDVLRWATHTAYPEARIPETPMPKQKRGIDPACFDLAKHFTADHPDEYTQAEVADLAAAIQIAVEDWFGVREASREAP